MNDGHLIGPAIAGLCLAGSVVKLALILCRPRVNRLGVLALLVLMSGWLWMSQVACILSLFSDSPWLMVIPGLVGMVSFPVSLVMAIMALAQERRQRGEFTQGKRQAVSALVFSGLVVGISVMAVIGGTVNGVSSALKNGAVPGVSSSQGTEDFKELNYRIGKLDRPWARVEKGKIMPMAQAMYTRSLPELYMTVTGEMNEVGLSREDLRAVVAAKLRSVADSCEEVGRETRLVNGVTFERITSYASGLKGTKVEFCYDQWLACTSRNVYQFNCWSRREQKDELMRATEAWVRTFHLLEMAPDAGVSVPLKDGGRPADGWSIQGLGADGWITSPPGAFPEADTVARKGLTEFCLVALPLPDPAGLREQEVEDRLLGTLGETLNRTTLKGPADITLSGMAGHVYDFDRTLEKGKYHFRARIIRQDRMSWMVLTWAPDGTDRAEGEKAAAAVRFTAPVTPPPSDAGTNPESAEGIAQAAPVMTTAVIHNRAMILNDLGIKLYVRQEYSRSMRFFEESLRLEPGDRAVLGNLLDSLTNQNRWREALDVLKEQGAEKDIADTPSIKSRKARILTNLDDKDGAAAVWADLFHNGYENQDHLLLWVNLELDREKPEAALKAVRDFAATHPSTKLTRWEAGILARMDQYPDALKLLEPLVEGGKPDFEALYLKGELENDAGRYEDAEKSATRLIAGGEDTPRTRMILGWSEWHRKSWKAARSAFEKAAEKAPNDPAIREAISMTNGALGQGTAEVSSTPIEPVAVPGPLRKAIDSRPTPPEELTKGHGAVTLERLTGSYFEPGKPAKVTQYYKVKVQDTSGVEAFSTLSLKFYPASERVYVNKLVVRDESGTIVQQGTSADAYTSGESGELVSGAQILRVPVPGLRRGCTLEAAITVEDKGKSSKPAFRRDLFASGFPTAVRACFFTGDTGIKILTSPGLTAAGPQAYAAFDLPAYRNETLSAPLEDWQPWLMAGPATADWKTPSLDYLKRLADRLKPDESTVRTAAQICQGLDTPREKLAAIVSHVQGTLTYKGLEFGTRALIPSAVDKIQSDHYGDCKDHTTLLYHLLRRAGIKCYPALVDTGGKSVRTSRRWISSIT